MRWLWPTLVVLLVAACGTTPTRRPPTAQVPANERGSATGATPHSSATGPAFNPCAPTRKHLDSDYTPGGLYAPGVSDSGPSAPIDVSSVREPVPHAEPRSRYGNRSPYTVLGQVYRVLDSAQGYHERGVASWYGTKFNGRATSSGELYDICSFTAAHKTLPLPSYVRVTNLDNGRSLIVRVNDRGPFHSGRIMDLSYAAAVRLGVDRTGTARVELQSIDSDGNVAPPTQLAEQAPATSDESPRPATASQVAAGRDDSDKVAVAADRDDSDKVVQVGSFGEKSNAKRLADRLQDAGVDDVDIDHAEVAGQDVWRVRIGPVSLEKLADLLQHLRQLDLPNPRVFSE
jgi:rare lipoprotein A